MDIATLLAVLLAGITYSLSTYFKKAQDQEFDWSKFFTTALVGGVVGLGAAFLKMDVPASYEYMLGLGVVPLIENVGKAIWRHWLAKLFE